MILGFKKKINGRLTNFREKILYSFWSDIPPLRPKIHTIREDKHNRWNDSRMIQAVTRGKNFSCEKFAEMKCTGVQKIKIKWFVVKEDNYILCVDVRVDGRYLGYEETKTLAINDGFDSVEDFLDWFNKDFEGKIIHWTHKRY